MRREAVMAYLDQWVTSRWIRRLDRAIACFLDQKVPGESGLVLMAAALVSHQLGRGHVCLDLQHLATDPGAVLALPPEDNSEKLGTDPGLDALSQLAVSDWKGALDHSSLVSGGDLPRPLVRVSHRLYLFAYWQHTVSVVRSIRQRMTKRFVLPDHFPERLDTLFSRWISPEDRTGDGVHWQSIAAAMAVRYGFSVISGGPGTGKTTLVVDILALLQNAALLNGDQPLKIRLAAPTGKAAARLTASIGGALAQLDPSVQESLPEAVTTLHRLLGSSPHTRHFRHHRQNPLHLDLLVVDEASMVDLEMMASLLDALPDHARLILLGDKDQLASVEAGAVLGDLCRDADPPRYDLKTAAWLKQFTGISVDRCMDPDAPVELQGHITVLRESHRFGRLSGIGRLARAVNQGDAAASTGLLSSRMEDLDLHLVQKPAGPVFDRLILAGRAGGYRTYLEALNRYTETLERTGRETSEDLVRTILEAFDRFRILTAVRRGPFGVSLLNEQVADILYREGLIPATSGWYPGRPVMVTRNDYNLGLMNGDVGIYMPVRDEFGGKIRWRVVFITGSRSIKKVLPSRLGAVETVFAMTVHKSQGSEFDHTALILPDKAGPLMTRELIYTAVTRSRRFFTLVTPSTEILEQAVLKQALRASGLADLLASGEHSHSESEKGGSS